MEKQCSKSEPKPRSIKGSFKNIYHSQKRIYFKNEDQVSLSAWSFETSMTSTNTNLLTESRNNHLPFFLEHKEYLEEARRKN